MKTKLTILLVVLTNLAVSAQDNTKTLKENNYSINYPSSWSNSDRKPQPTIKFLIMSPSDSALKDQFQENINLNTENLNGQDYTLDAYIKLSLDQIEKQVPSAKIITSKNINLNGIEAKEVIWRADFGNNMILKFKQYSLLHDGTAYILTYTSSESEYDMYLETANMILNSFKFTK